jgi:hypothetical protein
MGLGVLLAIIAYGGEKHVTRLELARPRTAFSGERS